MDYDRANRHVAGQLHQSPSTSSVVLEYSSEGRVVATGQPYGNRYVSRWSS
jgi:hypothetical protein